MNSIKELKYRAVVKLKKRQDPHKLAESLYRKSFDSTARITIREAFREDGQIVYVVSDRDGLEPLYLIK